MNPSAAGIWASLAWSRQINRSGVATSMVNRSAMLGTLADLFGFLLHVLDVALKQERLLRQIVVFAFHHFFETSNRVGERNILALQSGELLGDVERLGEEFLDLAGSGHRKFVVFRKFVNSQNRDDILQVL